MYGRERYQVIDEEIALCGYFVIITSEKMDAADALDMVGLACCNFLVVFMRTS